MTQKAKPRKLEKPEDPVKLEVAAELGLLEKIREHGWGSLSAKETGRIGGMITRRKQQEKIKAAKQNRKPSH
ncbi:MAG: small, acid-soluble spore protein, alpha/beta type [Caldicoprobacterales bacterium]|jgi:small acid-soluble spore protein F (minor alpha/beta-type SASP)|nr:small, acid-soluble spore protein, alpha/beta type [Clostridiales bacterium]